MEMDQLERAARCALVASLYTAPVPPKAPRSVCFPWVSSYYKWADRLRVAEAAYAL